MGGISSKTNSVDKWAYLEHYTADLSEKYEALQQKIDRVAEVFIEKEKFNERMSTLMKRFEENEKAIDALFQHQKELSAENEQFLDKMKSLEHQIQDQNGLIGNFQSIYFKKVESYKEINKSLGDEISALSKANRENDDIMKIRKLSKNSHANGICKVKDNKDSRYEENDDSPLQHKAKSVARTIQGNFNPIIIVPVPDN